MNEKPRVYELGRATFESGYVRKPALDTKFVTLLDKWLAATPISLVRPNEERMPRIMAVADAVTAWINGYDEANIAAYRSDLVHVPENAVLMIEWSSLGRRCTLRRET